MVRSIVLRLAHRQAADCVTVKADVEEAVGALAAQRRIVAPCTMPNRAAPALPAKARLLRSAQASERRIARSSSARNGQLQAFVELHPDVGAEQVLDLDRPLGRQLHRAVEMGAEAPSSTLRSSDSDITWKPPESVRIGCGHS